MQIVIIGAGEVGYYLARKLIQEDHDIRLIECQNDRQKRAAETLDAIVLKGSGTSERLLREAEVDQADIFIAVTGDDEVNILACLMARKLGRARCIARVKNSEFSQPQALLSPVDLGIDLMVHPEETTAQAIVRLVESSAVSRLVDFESGELQIVAIYIKHDSPIINQTIAQVVANFSKRTFIVLCIYRDEETIIPHGSHYFRAGDTVYLITRRNDLPRIFAMIGYSEQKQQHIMICGGGQVGRRLAAVLSSYTSVKLIEKDPSAADACARELRDTLVLQGDATDVDFLVSENIYDMDCFVAVTGCEKTNLLAGLLALDQGVRRIVVHLTTQDYFPIMKRIGIDAIVSKNIATVNAILKHIRRGDIIAVSLFEDIEAEAMELSPPAGSPITQKPLKDLKLPDDLIIGAVVRGSGIIIPDGHTRIQADDKVVVFLKPTLLSQVEKLFNN